MFPVLFCVSSVKVTVIAAARRVYCNGDRVLLRQRGFIATATGVVCDGRMVLGECPGRGKMFKQRQRTLKTKQREAEVKDTQD